MTKLPAVKHGRHHGDRSRTKMPKRGNANRRKRPPYSSTRANGAKLFPSTKSRLEGWRVRDSQLLTDFIQDLFRVTSNKYCRNTKLIRVQKDIVRVEELNSERLSTVLRHRRSERRYWEAKYHMNSIDVEGDESVPEPMVKVYKRAIQHLESMYIDSDDDRNHTTTEADPFSNKDWKRSSEIEKLNESAQHRSLPNSRGSDRSAEELVSEQLLFNLIPQHSKHHDDQQQKTSSASSTARNTNFSGTNSGRKDKVHNPKHSTRTRNEAPRRKNHGESTTAMPYVPTKYGGEKQKTAAKAKPKATKFPKVNVHQSIDDSNSNEMASPISKPRTSSLTRDLSNSSINSQSRRKEELLKKQSELAQRRVDLDQKLDKQGSSKHGIGGLANKQRNTRSVTSDNCQTTQMDPNGSVVNKSANMANDQTNTSLGESLDLLENESAQAQMDTHRASYTDLGAGSEDTTPTFTNHVHKDTSFKSGSGKVAGRGDKVNHGQEQPFVSDDLSAADNIDDERIHETTSSSKRKLSTHSIDTQNTNGKEVNEAETVTVHGNHDTNEPSSEVASNKLDARSTKEQTLSSSEVIDEPSLLQRETNISTTISKTNTPNTEHNSGSESRAKPENLDDKFASNGSENEEQLIDDDGYGDGEFDTDEEDEVLNTNESGNAATGKQDDELNIRMNYKDPMKKHTDDMNISDNASIPDHEDDRDINTCDNVETEDDVTNMKFVEKAGGNLGTKQDDLVTSGSNPSEATSTECNDHVEENNSLAIRNNSTTLTSTVQLDSKLKVGHESSQAISNKVDDEASNIVESNTTNSSNSKHVKGLSTNGFTRDEQHNDHSSKPILITPDPTKVLQARNDNSKSIEADADSSEELDDLLAEFDDVEFGGTL